MYLSEQSDFKPWCWEVLNFTSILYTLSSITGDMNTIDDLTLQDCDLEDIEDIIPKIERSFNLKFKREEFLGVKTFGDICKIVENHLDYQDQDCTLQQGFYIVRLAISKAQNIDQNNIKTSSKIEELFPRNTRIRDWKKVEKELGFRAPILNMKNELFLTLLAGFCLSTLCFFLSWKLALGGLIGFGVLSKFLALFSKELSLQTVGDVARKISSENYALVRRKNNSGNRQEVFTMIQELFASVLDIRKEFLTTEAKLPLK
jgi:hypothetical protein